MAKFDRKWPKMWPTCIFRPGEGSEGLKSDFGEKTKFDRKLAKNVANMFFKAWGGFGRPKK